MKKLAIVIFALCLGLAVFASDKEWMTDLDAAIKSAAQTGKPILVDFSGSDWCKWCIKFEKEVLSKKIFKDFAQKNLILVLIDFPNRKKQSPAQKQKNEALAEKYKVEGFPTLLLLDSKGKEIVRTNYFKGGPQAYIDFLKSKMPEKAKTPGK
ncbi:MAG: thioredoxin family protein [Victivallaceae bacterium]|nr:thioredoxin family protein [Victivallaceae bacterium]